MTLPFISQAITTDRVGAVLGVPFMLCADNHIGMNLGSWPSAEPTEGSQIYTSRKTVHSSTFSQTLNIDATVLLCSFLQRILS